jgi:DNA-binding LacI/PurR family transcriptional regulator
MSLDEPRRTASIRDVAKAAGVSRQTVSRVINNHPSLRPETRDRVLSVIDELQYRPNRIARALGTRRSQTLGVITSLRSQYGPAAAAVGIERAAQGAGYLVNTTNLTSASPEAIRAALQQAVDHQVDGLIIVAPQIRFLNAIDEMALDIPYVILNSRSEDDPREVFIDQYAGARNAIRHLLELGHRDICHLAGPQEWIEADARMRGFLDELSDADVPATAPILGDWTADFGYHAGRELVDTLDFTAIFASNDQMALGLIHAFRDAGLDVPRDVSVIGFDDVPEARHFWPPLTTVRQDFEVLGRLAVSRLIDLEVEPLAGRALKPELVVRSSTAPPRR